MKTQLIYFVTLLAFAPCAVHSQGTMIYDQQSSTDEFVFPNGIGTTIQQYTQFGQSFTPSLMAVDFIRLNLNDRNPSNSLGATVYLNLRTNAVSGSVLASTLPVTMTNGFSGVVDFIFAISVPVIPFVPYIFEPVVQTGDQWNILISEYNYPGGTVFVNGMGIGGMSDVWFREGIVVVPEPSSALLILFGGGVLFYVRRRK